MRGGERETGGRGREIRQETERQRWRGREGGIACDCEGLSDAVYGGGWWGVGSRWVWAGGANKMGSREGVWASGRRVALSVCLGGVGRVSGCWGVGSRSVGKGV